MVHRGKYLLFTLKLDFGLGGVDVHVHGVGPDGEVKDAAGEAAHHFLIFIGLLQGGHHGAAFDIAAVDEKVLKTPAAPATRWQGGETRHAHSLARTLDRRETQGQIPAQHGVDGAFQLAIPGSEQLLFAVPDELHGQLRVG